MESIWIIGGGRFGGLAAERLSLRRNPPEVVIVDPDEHRLSGLASHGETLRREDGIDFLVGHLERGAPPDWVVPALPRHLVAEWLLARLGPDRLSRRSIPAELEKTLPNPFRGESGDLYISFADFLCPDDCPEPADHCTATGRPRAENLFDRLATLSRPEYPVHVIRSHQLAPGVGGVRPARLAELRKTVAETPGPQAVATACRCHGVVTALERLSAG